MSKLLGANFSRLWKSKIFLGLEILSTLTGVFFYILFAVNTNNIGKQWAMKNAIFYFFLFTICIGFIMAVFTSLFIGTDYAERTIQNKLTVGHSRKDIYLVNLITVFSAGLIFIVSYLLAALLTGFITVGTLCVLGITHLIWRIACIPLIILAYSSFFTFLAMNNAKTALNSIISLALVLVIVLSGLAVYNRLQEPELKSQLVMQDDGSYRREDNIPNDRYISGTVRDFYEWVDFTLPSSQALHIIARDVSYDFRMPLCTLMWSVIFTASGIYLFRKKDIK